MGGAQPLAAVMAGASCLAVECQASRIEMRLRTGYLDVMSQDLDEALGLIERSCAEKKPLSVGPARQRGQGVPAAAGTGRTARRCD